MKRKAKEESIQIAISKYISLAYPDVIFTFDASGLRLPMGLAVKSSKMRSERGIPDLLIFEPRGGYSGLLIELKKLGESPYLKDGTISQSKSAEHVREQAAILERLQKKGYCATFCVGLDEAIKCVKLYMLI